MTKGAQPSDRVMRFLDAAGIVKREKRNNPQKAIPRKERKAQAEAAKAAEPARPLQPARHRPPERRATMAGGARVCLGQIGAAHGVRGEVRLRSFTSDPAAIADYGPLETEDGRVLEIETLRPAKDHFVVRLAGIRDRDAAVRADQREALRAARAVAADARPGRILSCRSDRACGRRPGRQGPSAPWSRSTISAPAT